MGSYLQKWARTVAVSALVLLMLAPGRIYAWYRDYPYAPYYQPYVQTPYPYFAEPYPRFGRWWGPRSRSARWYGYAQPKWSIRGRVNRFGDYRVDVKLRGISQQDMYYAWLLFNSMGFNQ